MASISKIVKAIKDEVKSNGSTLFFPLEDRELSNMQEKDNGKYIGFIEKVVAKLREDKQLFNVSIHYTTICTYNNGFKKVRTINQIDAMKKPCREFVSLNNWLNKYATRRLTPDEVREESISGKRSSYGVDYAHYLIHDSKVCKSLLEELRRSRSTKDTILLRRDEDTYWGDRFNSYGEDMECEWSGSKTYSVRFIIKTPTGREKKVITAMV